MVTRGVPVVRRGHDHGVDLVAVQQLAHIAVRRDPLVALYELVYLRTQIGAIHVA
jgi:hypothetical protein